MLVLPEKCFGAWGVWSGCFVNFSVSRSEFNLSNFSHVKVSHVA